MSEKILLSDLEMSFNVIRQEMLDDPSYLWAWHCNLAAPIKEVMGYHIPSNQAAALILAQIFKVDSTTCPEYIYPKSAAQNNFEARLEADSRTTEYDAYEVLKNETDT
jgi:hypothetical protein